MTAGTAEPWVRQRIRHHRAAGMSRDQAALHAAADLIDPPAGTLAGTMPITGPLLDLHAVAAGLAQLGDGLRPLADALAPMLAAPAAAEYVTPLQAAELMACTRQHVYDLIRQGHLPSNRTGRTGRRVLIRRADVIRHVEGSGSPRVRRPS